MKIASVRAWEILDSRGNPTIRAEVVTEAGHHGIASVPSGASTGTHEALELRDGDAKRYGGLGVLRAVEHVNGSIAKTLVGMDVQKQSAIDRAMMKLDGTENKANLGANAILAVSLATARAAAEGNRLPLYRYLRKLYAPNLRSWKLPTPMVNVINGGRHADSGLSVQEFMIVPRHERFSERVRIGAEIFHTLGGILKQRKLATTVGDEGGYAPQFVSPKSALVFDLLLAAITKAGYVPGTDVQLACDVAASEFYDSKKQVYYFRGRFGRDRIPWTAEQLIERIAQWVATYPMMSVEDPLAEDDWDAWRVLTSRLGAKAMIVGDDLFVTNVKRLRQGIRKHVANAILVKVNQIGTLSETFRVIAAARRAKYRVIISHRSGETSDTFIADLAVAVNAEYIKTGSLSRSERVEKYNRLLEIEHEIGS